MQPIAFTLIPVVAVLIGSLFAVSRRPSDAFVSAMQLLLAGVVFTAGSYRAFPRESTNERLAACGRWRSGRVFRVKVSAMRPKLVRMCPEPAYPRSAGSERGNPRAFTRITPW